MNNFSKILAVSISLAQGMKLQIENENGYTNGYLTPVKYNMAQIDEALDCNSSAHTLDQQLAQTTADTEFKFDPNTGEVIRTSFLSLDLLTLAQVLGISQGRTWGQLMNLGDKSGLPSGVDDKNIYTFLKSISEQNEKILAGQELQKVAAANQNKAALIQKNEILAELEWKTAKTIATVTGVGQEVSKDQWLKLSVEQKADLVKAQSKSNFKAASKDTEHILGRTQNIFYNIKSLATGLGGDYVTFIDYNFETEGAVKVETPKV